MRAQLVALQLQPQQDILVIDVRRLIAGFHEVEDPFRQRGHLLLGFGDLGKERDPPLPRLTLPRPDGIHGIGDQQDFLLDIDDLEIALQGIDLVARALQFLLVALHFRGQQVELRVLVDRAAFGQIGVQQIVHDESGHLLVRMREGHPHDIGVGAGIRAQALEDAPGRPADQFRARVRRQQPEQPFLDQIRINPVRFQRADKRSYRPFADQQVDLGLNDLLAVHRNKGGCQGAGPQIALRRFLGGHDQQPALGRIARLGQDRGGKANGENQQERRQDGPPGIESLHENIAQRERGGRFTDMRV